MEADLQQWFPVKENENGHRKALVLLRIPRDYDLVLELDSLASRRKFIAKLEAFLASHKKHFTLSQVGRDIMLAKAETKERRQKKLEQVAFLFNPVAFLPLKGNSIVACLSIPKTNGNTVSCSSSGKLTLSLSVYDLVKGDDARRTATAGKSSP